MLFRSATNNAHMFYIVCRSLEERTGLISYLKTRGILAVFHYLSLHKSRYYTTHANCRPDNCQEVVSVGDEQEVVGLNLPNCDRFADCLVRMPMFFELTEEQVDMITDTIIEYYSKEN